MRKFVAFLIFALAVVANAQEQGRPDPTGQGRYLQFGPELAYPAARVITQLPAGVECASAGEIIGVRVWNSTREGFAILSELTDKAQIAVTDDGRVFLCHCARGFNQLFSIKTEQAKSNEPPLPKVTPATTPILINIDVNVDNEEEEEEEEEEEVTPRRDQRRRPSWAYRNRNRLAAGAVAVGTGTYFLGRYLCWWR